MNIIESIADRRIKAARKAGLFDNLAGAGKPIPDIDQQRPPGWWAARVARRERSIIKAEELDATLQKAMPSLWRSPSAVDVIATVSELNKLVDEYNRVTTWDSRDRLDVDEIVDRWHTIQRSQPRGNAT